MSRASRVVKLEAEMIEVADSRRRREKQEHFRMVAGERCGECGEIYGHQGFCSHADPDDDGDDPCELDFG